MFNREPGVLPGANPFEQHLHGRDVLKLIDELPGQMGCRRTTKSRRVEILIHGLAHEARARCPSVAIGANTHVSSARPRQSLAASGCSLVESKREHGTSGGLGSLHKTLSHGPLGSWIQLIPDGRATRCSDLLYGGCGVCGKNLQVVACPCALGSSQFAVFVKSPLAGDGRQDDRRGPFAPEKLDAHVDMPRIDQTART